MRPYPNIALERLFSLVLFGVCMTAQITYILVAGLSTPEKVSTHNMSIEVEGKCCRCASVQLLSALKNVPGNMPIDQSCKKDAI